MNDEHVWRECMADACKQGRCPCPCPNDCWHPVDAARSWLLADLAVMGIGLLCVVGFIAGWFS